MFVSPSRQQVLFFNTLNFTTYELAPAFSATGQTTLLSNANYQGYKFNLCDQLIDPGLYLLAVSGSTQISILPLAELDVSKTHPFIDFPYSLLSLRVGRNQSHMFAISKQLAKTNATANYQFSIYKLLSPLRQSQVLPTIDVMSLKPRTLSEAQWSQNLWTHSLNSDRSQLFVVYRNIMQ